MMEVNKDGKRYDDVSSSERTVRGIEKTKNTSETTHLRGNRDVVNGVQSKEEQIIETLTNVIEQLNETHKKFGYLKIPISTVCSLISDFEYLLGRTEETKEIYDYIHAMYKMFLSSLNSSNKSEFWQGYFSFRELYMTTKKAYDELFPLISDMSYLVDSYQELRKEFYNIVLKFTEVSKGVTSLTEKLDTKKIRNWLLVEALEKRLVNVRQELEELHKILCYYSDNKKENKENNGSLNSLANFINNRLELTKNNQLLSLPPTMLFRMSKLEILVFTVIDNYRLPFVYTGSGYQYLYPSHWYVEKLLPILKKRKYLPDFVRYDGKIAIEVYDVRSFGRSNYEVDRRKKLLNDGYDDVIFIEFYRDVLSKGDDWYKHVYNLLKPYSDL